MGRWEGTQTSVSWRIHQRYMRKQPKCRPCHQKVLEGKHRVLSFGEGEAPPTSTLAPFEHFRELARLKPPPRIKTVEMGVVLSFILEVL